MKTNNKNPVGRRLLVAGCWLLVNQVSDAALHLQNTTAVAAATTPPSRSSAAKEPSSSLKNKLMRIELNLPEYEKDEDTRDELKKMIEQIRSVDFAMPQQQTLPEIVPEVTPLDKPDPPAIEIVRVPEEKKAEPNLPQQPTTEKPPRLLDKIPANPEDVNDPFALAETLFLSQYLEQAAVFYREALKRLNTGQTPSVDDRAWIMFQIANCLRNENRPEAAKMYLRFITQYPDSPWRNIALARKQLLDWYIKEQPHKLIAERRK
jgi:tetratricopeptide (TPR) repeat protein